MFSPPAYFGKRRGTRAKNHQDLISPEDCRQDLFPTEDLGLRSLSRCRYRAFCAGWGKSQPPIAQISPVVGFHRSRQRGRKPLWHCSRSTKLRILAPRKHPGQQFQQPREPPGYWHDHRTDCPRRRDQPLCAHQRQHFARSVPRRRWIDDRVSSSAQRMGHRAWAACRPGTGQPPRRGPDA